MNVKRFATGLCSHRPYPEKQLQHAGIPDELLFVADEPETATRHAIRQSPERHP
ncbi:MAG: hypothetical protein J5I92_00895 [Thiogranum sp.]|nr:hypothetical protein [Thiogranum sp.]